MNFCRIFSQGYGIGITFLLAAKIVSPTRPQLPVEKNDLALSGQGKLPMRDESGHWFFHIIFAGHGVSISG
ncbi:hypothetical protein ECL_01458 [Enterobacter cloacae subsp. cloacae ATCC 13047]|nr:hypothetical protein ECL_01458 [Enterobacter cloacae subsp. cloacae ATCC 13047]OOC84395.1 hypothetical protein BWP06_18535 [Enterobacter cloacae]